MMTYLMSPWAHAFESMLGQVTRSLVVCSPYIGRGPCERIARAISGSNPPEVSVFVLTDLSRDNVLSGATDVAALGRLCEAVPRTEVRFLPNLHAKVYVADDSCAVVTSANLTLGGLQRNLEYGLCLRDPDAVRRVRADIMEYGALGSTIGLSRLKMLERIVDDLRETQATVERSLKARLRREFDAKLKAADLEILRFRAEGLTAHAAFADTILYVLRRGAADTRAIYSHVQAIHPDLCDDSIKLEIRGELWSQAKWHHCVRQAQLFLKRQGKIRREDGKWRLV